MIKPYSDRARKVMQFANQEAQRLNHEYIGTEHILLGLAKQGEGVASQVLNTLGVPLQGLRHAVEAIIQSGPHKVVMGKLPQTPRAKKVIEYAIEEAREDYNIGTAHILLGLVREQEGVAGQVLRAAGVTVEKVCESVFKGHDIHDHHKRWCQAHMEAMLVNAQFIRARQVQTGNGLDDAWQRFNSAHSSLWKLLGLPERIGKV